MAAMGADGDPMIRASQDPKFGDYQCNAAMGLAKKLGKKPRDVAADIIAKLEVADLCSEPEIAGPGFINFTLTPEFLSKSLGGIPPAGGDAPDGVAAGGIAPAGAAVDGVAPRAGVDRLGIAATDAPQVVVVDLSSPNLAKEMHVGHLRSTVIGDCICRILEFEGHTVHRENHVGDWGTQFGMLVAHLLHEKPDVAEHPDELVIADLESFYVAAKNRFDADDDFKTEARDTVVKLQQGDPDTRKIWKAFCNESLRHCHEIYDRLHVSLEDRGESFYTERMETIVQRIDEMRLRGDKDWIQISDGALCLFLEGFTTRDGEPLPMIVRKSDGGFNYATSDLATIAHRVEELGAQRILYVVGLPQKQHFEMLFAAVEKLGWAEGVELEHIGFGSVLSKTGTMFKTREGGTFKLKAVLDEAVARARAVIEEQESGDTGRGIDPDEVDKIAEAVGIGAVKYFDLAHARQSDYKFDLDTMVAMDGNTAPYMMYAYARVRSIGRKAGVDLASLPTDAPLVLEHPAELALARKLVQLPETLHGISRDLRPNVLTEYLYDLAKTFSRFYDKKHGVRVIDAEPEAVRTSRLRLCDLTARTLKLGLHLLGIETVERM